MTVIDLEDWMRTNDYDVDAVDEDVWDKLGSDLDEEETLAVQDHENDICQELMLRYKIQKKPKTGDRR